MAGHRKFMKDETTPAKRFPIRALVGDAPEGVRGVVRDEKGAVAADGDADGAAPDVPFGGDETVRKSSYSPTAEPSLTGTMITL